MCICVCICICVSHMFCIHLSINRHFGCFHVLAFVNNITINRRMQMCLQDSDFISFGCIPRRGIAGSCDSTILTFLRNFHNVFHSDYTNLHSHHQFTRVPFSPHHLQYLFFLIFFFFDDSHYKRSEVISHYIWFAYSWWLAMRPFMYLLAICISSLEKCLFSSFAHF